MYVDLLFFIVAWRIKVGKCSDCEFRDERRDNKQTPAPAPAPGALSIEESIDCRRLDLPQADLLPNAPAHCTVLLVLLVYWIELAEMRNTVDLSQTILCRRQQGRLKEILAKL